MVLVDDISNSAIQAADLSAQQRQAGTEPLGGTAT